MGGKKTDQEKGVLPNNENKEPIKPLEPKTAPIYKTAGKEKEGEK